MAEARLEYLKPIWVAALRHAGAHDPRLTDQTWQELILWAAPRRLLGRDPAARGIGLLWDDPRSFGPAGRRYDVGVPVTAEDVEAVDEPGFIVVTAPGRYLRATHVGAYERIFDTYERIVSTELRYGGWTLLAQPIVEIYRDSPSEVAEQELRTDIYFPVAKV